MSTYYHFTIIFIPLPYSNPLHPSFIIIVNNPTFLLSYPLSLLHSLLPLFLSSRCPFHLSALPSYLSTLFLLSLLISSPFLLLLLSPRFFSLPPAPFRPFFALCSSSLFFFFFVLYYSFSCSGFLSHLYTYVIHYKG